MKKYVIETESLTKEYNAQTAVDKLNLHVHKGKIYTLLGRNGAGKTTTMKMLLNLSITVPERIENKSIRSGFGVPDGRTS